VSPSARPSPTGTRLAVDELPRRASRVTARAAQTRMELSGAQLALEATHLGLLDLLLGAFTPVRALELCLRSEHTHRGRDAARACAEQPDQLQFEYVFPGARVFQRVYVARERAAAWMELEVECSRTLQLELHFVAPSELDALEGTLQPVLARDDETGAAALQHHAHGWAFLVASPEAEPFELRAASSAERRAVLTLPCSPARAALGPLVVMLAGARGGIEPLAQARESQRWIARHWNSECAALASHWRTVLGAPLQLSSSDAALQQRMLWAKVEARRAALRVAQLADGAHRAQRERLAQCERAVQRALELCSHAPEADELSAGAPNSAGGLLGRLQRAQQELRAVVLEAAGLVASVSDGVLVLRPHLSLGADETRLDGVQVGATRFDLELRRERGAAGRSALTLALDNWSGPPLKVLLRPLLAPLSRAVREDEGSVEARERPVEARERPVEARERPVEARERPVEARERPVEARERDGELVAHTLAREVHAATLWRVSCESGPHFESGAAPLETHVIERSAQHVVWRVSGPAGAEVRLPWRSDRAVRVEGDASTHGDELHLHFPRPGLDGLSTLTLRAFALD